ncbi:MAG: hypothetical protein GW913_14365 [Myxococcales bacterium]|nr:hypothetical protein [Myxococcales bacterium]
MTRPSRRRRSSGRDPEGGRVMGRRALVLGGGASLLMARLASAQDASEVTVVIYTVGETGTGLVVRGLRDALHGLPVSLTVTLATTLDEARYLPQAACTLAITLEEGDALVLRMRPDGSHLLRRVPLRGRLDAAARAAIGHIVRTSVESVLRLRRP